MNIFKKLFRADRQPDEVARLLRALLDRSISDEEWDDFMSVKIVDPELECIRERMEEIWVENSPYMVFGSVDPRDLNPHGVTEIHKLLESLGA